MLVYDVSLHGKARRALFAIKANSAASLAGIFQGFEGIFVPAGSGLGTYDLTYSYGECSCLHTRIDNDAGAVLLQQDALPIVNQAKTPVTQWFMQLTVLGTEARLVNS